MLIRLADRKQRCPNDCASGLGQCPEHLLPDPARYPDVARALELLRADWTRGDIRDRVRQAIAALERAAPAPDERHLFNPSCPCETCSQTRAELFDKHIGRSHIIARASDVARALELLRVIINDCERAQRKSLRREPGEHVDTYGADPEWVLVEDVASEAREAIAALERAAPAPGIPSPDEPRFADCDQVTCPSCRTSFRLGDAWVKYEDAAAPAPDLPEGWRWEGDPPWVVNYINKALTLRVRRDDVVEVRVNGNEWANIPVAVLRALLEGAK
jgi:hypothetical protein